MMIEKYISALLYRYQCVTIPGFGAFLAETQPARLDAETHTFYPPKKLISFNANLKNNDGLLANHIALQEKISFDEATAAINKKTALWQAELKNGTFLLLKNIGQLSRNAEGNIVFVPETPVNYLTDAFGLASFVSPAVKREELKAVAEAIEEKAPVVFTPERKRNYSYLKYAAIFVVALTAGAAGFKVYHDNEVARQTLLVEKAVQEKVQNRIQQATFFIDNPIPAVKLTVKEETKILPYHIIAGAFRSEENAGKAAAKLKAKGFTPERLEKNKYGLYPVSYGSYATYAEAQDTMRKIHRTYDREAWIFIKE
ncbi:SPOR domain-containing protein [Flavobacterium sp. MK4S-17]|uniref:HU domain-containing protein n=1 Tax=Flavobacterium sp. MK4S-17 TaxID=2543737 RepID=UPI00135708E3|nr:SPOR domain-containing protein [Flavobacterium sp. MK4S-17]